MKDYTVWVGGSEMNSHLLSFDEANSLKAYWIGRGYNDVAIEKVSA